MSKGLYTVSNMNLTLEKGGKVGSRLTEKRTIKNSLEIITRQLTLLGRRERTIHDYTKWTLNFCDVTGSVYLSDITVESIYSWLSSMNVSASTRNIRLKSFKAVLSRFFDNGWLPSKFWKNIVIKVDIPVKAAATDKDIALLLSVLDLSNWYELRDATAILLMYRTGIRLETLTHLNETHVNFTENVLNLSPDIMKGHEYLKLPIDSELITLLEHLILHNKTIRRRRNKRNSFIFITNEGNKVQSSFNNNVIQKRLIKYGHLLNLNNVNPHALRRGFATNLMKKDAPVALISKALGHKDISTTTRYLYMDKEEVANSLRNYL